MGTAGMGGALGLAALESAGASAGGGWPFARASGRRLTRAPLADVPYDRLPLGAVRPAGWLEEQLRRMGDGMAGRLDELYTNVDDDNAWLGGRGDNWERGPYWADGLVPLAYLLEDDALIEKANRWVEWALRSQRSDGYFGPPPDKSYKDDPPGKSDYFFQTDNPGDWWPRMVMLKALRSYHEATGDERVLDHMTRYFRYQQATLPQRPLGHWTWWGRMRGGENQASIYWLYNRTGDDFLLELASLVFEQTADWTDGFRTTNLPSRHGVNVAMGLKQPALQYLQAKDERFLRAPDEGLRFLTAEHGQPQGLFSGDEVTLRLPMTVDTSRWHENAAAVERGPLVYALPVDGTWRELGDDYEPTWELEEQVPTRAVEPTEPWNYGVVLAEDEPSLEVVEREEVPAYPWTADAAPIRLAATGKRLPQWNEYHGGAGPLPPSPVDSEEPEEELTLVPYGATTLRVAELPVARPE